MPREGEVALQNLDQAGHALLGGDETVPSRHVSLHPACPTYQPTLSMHSLGWLFLIGTVCCKSSENLWCSAVRHLHLSEAHAFLARRGLPHRVMFDDQMSDRAPQVTWAGPGLAK
jgi:hypothetical protein